MSRTFEPFCFLTVVIFLPELLSLFGLYPDSQSGKNWVVVAHVALMIAFSAVLIQRWRKQVKSKGKDKA